MISGADIRRYRKLIGMNQIAFAERFGVSQSTLSVIEGGRIAVSGEHIERLKSQFDEPRFKHSFSRFLQSLQTERAAGQEALATPEGCLLTLTVWAWAEGFDLGQRPAPDRTRGLVTIRVSHRPAIAFEMNRRTEGWEKGEILVFEQFGPDDVEDGDLCLIQIKRPRARGMQTMIATVRVSRTTHLRTLCFEPISPSLPPFAATEVTLIAILILVHRARYIRSD